MAQWPGTGTENDPWLIAHSGGLDYQAGNTVKAYVSPDGKTLKIYHTGSGQSNMADFWDTGGVQGGESPWWFTSARNTIETIVIENGVTNIGRKAFKDLQKLQGIIAIPSTVTKINAQAFLNCTHISFQSINIPTSVAEIEGEAFKNCAVKTITIAESSTNLTFKRPQISGTYYDNWFVDCQTETLFLGRQCIYEGNNPPFKGMPELKNLTIGKNVNKIGASSYANCSKLENVILEDGADVLYFGTQTNAETVFDNCLNLKDLYLGRKIHTWSNVHNNGWAFSADYKSPFHNKTLTTITVGNNVQWDGNDGNYIFYGCSNLDSVKLGANIRNIGNFAFYNSSSLTNVIIPNSVKVIGISAFQNSGLTSISIPNSITHIYGSAFADCNLTNVILKDGANVLYFGTQLNAETVFGNCPDIKNLYLGRDINAWSSAHNSGWAFSSEYKSPFHYKALTTVTVGNNVKWDGNNGNYIFYGCSSLDSVKLGTGIENIGNFAFYGSSSLTGIIIHSSVKVIGTSAFQSSGLTSISIPNSITRIYSYAFADCNLANVILKDGANVLSFGTQLNAETVFSNCPNLKYLYLGRKMNTWSNAHNSGWTFSSNYHSPFYNKTTLKTLIVGKDITEISDYTFYGCCELEEIICYPTEPPTIYANTFGGCGKSIPNCTVYVPEGSVHLYKAAEGWKDFIIEEIPVGISDISTNSIQIYPNPTKTEIFIKSDLRIEKIEIYSIIGAILKFENSFNRKILVSDLAKGIYFLKVYTDKGVTVGKFVKE